MSRSGPAEQASAHGENLSHRLQPKANVSPMPKRGRLVKFTDRVPGVSIHRTGWPGQSVQDWPGCASNKKPRHACPSASKNPINQMPGIS